MLPAPSHNFIRISTKYFLIYFLDDNRELSSPIHRTEEKFAIEDPNSERASAKPCARLNRFKHLASEISNWEDDLSHPTLVNNFDLFIKI